MPESKREFRHGCLHLACVVGARPNFVKMAPILKALKEYPDISATLVHTGQHYDVRMSEVFFEQLGMRHPDVSLEVGSGKHGEQTSRILERFEEVLIGFQTAGKPADRTIVVGDVNSTMACALASVKLGIPVAHVEAGLRSFDRSMPEEINRIVTDSISDMLLVTEPSGVQNLRREGHPAENIYLVGNVMIDTLLQQLPHARALSTLADLGLKAAQYGIVTLHRPANVDKADALTGIVNELLQLSESLPLVFAVHPRTEARLKTFGLSTKLEQAKGILQLPPQGYSEFLCLTSQAKLVITDSGGLQEETTALGIPCLTLRPNTERPITLEEGTSRLVKDPASELRHQIAWALQAPTGQRPALWDGFAAQRLVKAVHQRHLQPSPVSAHEQPEKSAPKR